VLRLHKDSMDVPQISSKWTACSINILTKCIFTPLNMQTKCYPVDIFMLKYQLQSTDTSDLTASFMCILIGKVYGHKWD